MNFPNEPPKLPQVEASDMEDERTCGKSFPKVGAGTSSKVRVTQTWAGEWKKVELFPHMECWQMEGTMWAFFGPEPPPKAEATKLFRMIAVPAND
jgi:hypothetical protein